MYDRFDGLELAALRISGFSIRISSLAFVYRRTTLVGQKTFRADLSLPSRLLT